MANEPSIPSNKTTPSGADSYVGSFISVTSKSEIRYEGVLYYLNPQDSTLGLQNVKSYGTEGRKKDGSEVPPSDKMYEYILFRGSDIKDLEVKTSPSVQTEEPIYNDPAIIQSNHYAGPSSSLKSVPSGSGSLSEFNLYSEPSALKARSYPGVLPSHHSGSQLDTRGSSQPTDNSMSPYGMPTPWQGYNGAPGSIPGAHQYSLSSTSTLLYPLQNQESTTIAVTSSSNNTSAGYSFSTSNLNATPLTDSISSKLSPTFHHSTLINSNGLTMPFPLTYQNMNNNEAVVTNRVGPDHASLLLVQSSPYSTSSISDTISDPLLWQQPPLLTPNQLSQPRLSEHFPEKNLYPNQKDFGVMGSMPLNFSSSAASPAVQPPLLPLPPPTAKLPGSSRFTEEFDFQAMNEKFKRYEVWGSLGKANQRDKVEGIQESGTSSPDSGDDNSSMVCKSEAKPAYNKDDFFDTISCNSIGRGVRNGQNRFLERAKLDSETFGKFQHYNGYGGGRHGEHRGPYNWGRGYNYGNRGRGGFRQR